MHPMLTTAVKAARRAGSIINRASLNPDRFEVTRKGARDYVTDIDHEAEQAIIDILHTAYPHHAFLAEESGVTHQNAQHDAEFEWVIDPLDGTTNFIHGLPTFAVSIGLRQRGQVVQAVVYDPSRNELFTASRGGGAFLNDRRMRVSGQLRLSDALLGARWPGVSGPDASGVQRFTNLANQSSGVRRTGSSVLDMVYVGAGRFDAFCASDLKPWDMAAASLIVLEAGGLVCDFEGEQTWMDHGNVLASTPKILSQMLSILKQTEA
ncbi:MAG: inositol monophosphatase [Burkholderiaceae bacterium]|nr:inositol monophosphatase [Burkholderiaceae bacterium]